MGSCVSKRGESSQELDPFAARDESSQTSDLSSDFASHWSGLISESFYFSNFSRKKVDESLLAYVTNEAKIKHLSRSKAERRSISLHNSISQASQWRTLDSPPLSPQLKEIGDHMADEMQQLPQVRFIDMRSHSLEKILIDSPVASHVDPIHAPLARHLPHHGVDLNSGELSIFEAESYFKESEPFSRAAAGGVTVPMAVADLGESASIYLSDSDREKESSLLSECCTFNLSESVHELSSNKLTNLLAGKGDAYLPFVLHRGEEVNKNKSNDLDFYLDICSESVKLPNANDLAMDVAMCSNVLNKFKRTDDELSVRISSKAPLSSVYRQMRDPGGGVFWSYGDDTRSSVSSLELKTASSADNQLYSTRSDSPTANSQDEDIPRLSCTDSLPFHLPNLKATLSLGNDIVYPPRSISFRRIFAPSLSSIPYLEDAHVLHPSTNDATARIRRISQH